MHDQDPEVFWTGRSAIWLVYHDYSNIETRNERRLA